MVDEKYSGIVYEVKMKSVFHATLEVLKLEVYVDPDGSHEEEEDL